MKKEFDASDFVLALMVVLVVFAVLGAVCYSNEKPTSTQTLQVESGEWFECDFFSDGDMICEKVGDPDVGGGRMTP